VQVSSGLALNLVWKLQQLPSVSCMWKKGGSQLSAHVFEAVQYHARYTMQAGTRWRGIDVSLAHALPDCDALMFTVSGNVPEEPVCTADGYVFEKRLVEKHLEVSSLPAKGSSRPDGAQGVADAVLTCQLCCCKLAVTTYSM
jgi:hypothetical protein